MVEERDHAGGAAAVQLAIAVHGFNVLCPCRLLHASCSHARLLCSFQPEHGRRWPALVYQTHSAICLSNHLAEAASTSVPIPVCVSQAQLVAVMPRATSATHSQESMAPGGSTIIASDRCRRCQATSTTSHPRGAAMLLQVLMTAACHAAA